ncbi:YceI family protein [Pseudoxanthomonas sangjuensis]|uniref:YceI family protein n=1 Tax=Pseudoxanthomonas sangjuensis TaxID=1503750 RepID=UPI001FE5BB8E|nr:YceI family protein [Pseudoxanthomonas sangjuensis]
MTGAIPRRTRARRRGWLALACAMLACGAARAGAGNLEFDPAHSRFGFELRTRWGQKLEGRFPHYDGHVVELPDGRHQVRLRFFTADVEIAGHPRYTEWTRGPRFFDAEKYPTVSFVSEPYDPALLAQGGKLAGKLAIRGIQRPKSLDVEAAACARPALDCDVVATGAVSRADYDMDNWQLAVNDRVVFVLRARLRENTAP